jgi:hypothetical protein
LTTIIPYGVDYQKRIWVQRERLKAQGTGHMAKIIKENLSSPYALRLTPYAILFGMAKPLNPDLALSTNFSMLINFSPHSNGVLL